MARTAVVATFAAVSLAGAASHHWRGPSMGSWREPSRTVASLDPAGNSPVLFSSGFVESNVMDWEHAQNRDTHLFVPLQVYPIANHWYPLPYRLDDRARDYAARLFDGELNGRRRIILLAYEPSDLTRWLTWELEDRHYHVHSESPDSIVLLVFDLNANESPQRSAPR